MQFATTIKPTLVIAALTAASIPVSTALAATEASDWRFEVLLDDKEIGYHEFRLSDDGRRQVLETEASFDVKLLFITAFRYRHQNTEIWNDGCLASIEAATNNNGDLLEVSGQQLNDAFRVTRQSGQETLEDCVQTFAYWNPEILKSERLLNSQTGEYEQVSVVLEGEDQVLVNDMPVDALRYRLIAEAGDIKLWYSNDEARRWLALEAPAKGGRKIRYKPLTVPTMGPGASGLAAAAR